MFIFNADINIMRETLKKPKKMEQHVQDVAQKYSTIKILILLQLILQHISTKNQPHNSVAKQLNSKS